MTQSAQEQEHQFVQRAQAGDRQAFAGLYQMFADRLYRQILYPYAPDPTTAEDLLKETFLKAMEQIHTFHWDASRGFFPWIARIARNMALDRHRRQSTVDRTEGAYRQHIEQLTIGATPEALLGEMEENAMLKQRIHALLEQLNPRYRQAIVLRIFEERSREECAAALDIQINNFDVVFFRAIRAFRTLWETQEGIS